MKLAKKMTLLSALLMSSVFAVSANAATFTVSSTEYLFNPGMFFEQLNFSISEASVVSYSFSGLTGSYSLFVPALTDKAVPANTFASGTLLSAGNYSFNIFGNLTSASGQFTYTLSAVTAAVPEPQTTAMMALGLGLMGLISRRKKQ
ncbi:FxDxF family PEP-CTERM protein [Methylophilus methylotrophus]|uniref:FxDxF family PEP-CTERM protein n=1 Tax=Methylophilus methylotrophus TaxID=17 RepID=UPI000375A9BD|nr:FxDxF family PEP-CTERM protein [Methylophilus methylotrophus]